MSWIMMFWNIIVILVQNVGPLFFAAGVILGVGFWLAFLFIVPAMKIRKEIKSGKSFGQAWSEVFKGSSYNEDVLGGAFSQSSDYHGTSITDYANNPLYSSVPGNIYYRD